MIEKIGNWRQRQQRQPREDEKQRMAMGKKRNVSARAARRPTADGEPVASETLRVKDRACSPLAYAKFLAICL